MPLTDGSNSLNQTLENILVIYQLNSSFFQQNSERLNKTLTPNLGNTVCTILSFSEMKKMELCIIIVAVIIY